SYRSIMTRRLNSYCFARASISWLGLPRTLPGRRHDLGAIISSSLDGPRPLAASAACRAKSSALRLCSSSACPLVQRHSTWCRAIVSSSVRHRSAFLTGCLAAVRQPLACHWVIHWVIPLRRYSLSLHRVTRQG